jgi:disulfide bond formation protein DsbB
VSLAACGGGSTSSGSSGGGSSQQTSPAAPAGDAAAGKQIFTTTCSACHGPEGKGVPGLGKDMTASEFITSQTDTELVNFIKIGRDPSDPLNTTGVAMPPKGGNPALSDDDLLNVVAFIRTLQQ